MASATTWTQLATLSAQSLDEYSDMDPLDDPELIFNHFNKGPPHQGYRSEQELQY